MLVEMTSCGMPYTQVYGWVGVKVWRTRSNVLEPGDLAKSRKLANSRDAAASPSPAAQRLKERTVTGDGVLHSTSWANPEAIPSWKMATPGGSKDAEQPALNWPPKMFLASKDLLGSKVQTTIGECDVTTTPWLTSQMSFVEGANCATERNTTNVTIVAVMLVVFILGHFTASTAKS